MKAKFTFRSSKNLILPAAISAAFSLIGQASAANLTWDIFGAGPSDGLITGGAGTWDTTVTNWTSDGGANNIAWNNANNDTAVFGGTGGAVTLGTGVTVGGLTFNSNTYSFLPAGNVITFAGATPTITSASGVSTTIVAGIAGSGGLTKAGAGTTILQVASSALDGPLVVNAGVIGLNTATVLTNIVGTTSNSALTMNGGALQYLVGSSQTATQTFSGTTFNAGYSTVQTNKQGTSTTATLNLGTVSRTVGATANFFISGNGGTTRRLIQGSFTVSSTILDSGVAYGTFVNSTGSAPTPTLVGNDWAAYSGTPATVQAATYTPSTASTLAGDANVATGIDTTLIADAAITSLRANFLEARSINLGGFSLTTGGILVGSTVAANTTSITNGTLKSAATASGKDLVIFTNNTGITAIGATIADAAAGATGLTKSGPGNLTLSGTNSYTGSTIISAGSLTSSLGAALSSTPSVSIGSGAALTVSYGGPSSYTNPEITTLLAKTTFADATSGFGFDTTDATGGTANYAGGFSGGTGLAKSGTGTLVLTGANSHTGTTSVFGGTLQVANTGSLGGTTLGTVVSNGATVALSGGITITGEALSLLGEGVSTGGALRNVSGTNSWTGDIILAGTARINADAGSLTLGAVGISGILELSGNGNISVNGLVTGTTAVVVDDLIGNGTTSGTMTLSGINTNTGSLTVNSGKLSLTGNRTAAAGAITVGNTATKTGTLAISNGAFSTGIGDITVAAVAGATGIINHTVGTLSTTPTGTGNGRVLIGSIGTGTYNLSGGTLNANGTGTSAFILGTNSGGIATFNLSGSGSVVMGSPNGYLQIGRSNSTTSANTGSFIQTGGSASISNLSMGGGGVNNDGSIGILEVTAGTFTVADAGAFNVLSAGPNCSSSILIGGTAVVTLPAFPIARGAGSTATLTFDGGTLKPTALSATYMGGLREATIQDGGAKFDVDTGKDILISQALLTHLSSLGGGLTKAGLGTLALSGVNTYTGPTAVNVGTLGLETSGVINSASAVTVASGATLAGTGTAAGTLASSGKISPGTLGVGTLTTGAATLSAGALAIEVSDTTADKLVSTGAINLAGATLTVAELATGTAPTYIIAEGASLAGTFATPTLPPGYSVTYTGTQVILNAPASGSYTTWASANGIPGQPAADDFDKDGLSNLVEYALNLNPTVSTVPPGTFAGGILSFTKGTEALANGDVTFEIEQSTTLTGWTVVVFNNPSLGTISYTLPPGQAKEFARLKITQIP